MNEQMQQQLNLTFPDGAEPELELAIQLYGQPLLRYCNSILADYYEAQDAVQETFLRAYQKRRKFQSGSSLSAWLYTIAYRICIDRLRQKKWPFFRDSKDLPPAQAAATSLDEDLRQALLRLAPLDRAIIYCRAIEEMDYSELAVIFGHSAATLRKRYQRAKQKLLDELSPALQQRNREEPQNGTSAI